jgi:very-short-patch-repair endonuclease
MTEAERKLWSILRGNRFGEKFRRQFPFGRYNLDFYCHRAKLNIELDGGQHYTDEGIANDKERDEYLRENGIVTLRFPNFEVFQNLDGVLQVIYQNVQERIAELKI